MKRAPNIPTVSIIVPVYNVESYLHRCVDSLLNQTYTDFELILVDDGSQDRSGLICDEYKKKDSRIAVIHKINGGLSEARNAGLASACGKYVIFVDSDDYLIDGALTLLTETAETECADAVFYKLVLLSELSKNLRDPQRIDNKLVIRNNKENKFQFLLDRSKLAQWSACTALFRRQVLVDNQLAFIKGLFAEDLPFTLSFVCRAETIVSIDSALYCYDNTRSNSIMHTSRFPNVIGDIVTGLKYLSVFYEEAFADDRFCLIHHAVIKAHTADLYGLSSVPVYKQWDRALHALKDLDFFKYYNTAYRSMSEKGFERQKRPWMVQIDERIVDSYLSDMRYATFIWRKGIWSLGFSLYRFLRILYRGIRRFFGGGSRNL